MPRRTWPVERSARSSAPCQEIVKNIVSARGWRISTYLCRQLPVLLCYAQEVGPSGVVLRPAGEKHSNRYGRGGSRSLIIEVKPERLAMISEVTSILDCAAFFTGGSLASFGLRIYREFTIMDCVAPLSIEALVLEMLVETTREAARLERDQPRWLRVARDLVHDEFSQTLSLSSVAEVVGVHPAHLARCSAGTMGARLGNTFGCCGWTMPQSSWPSPTRRSAPLRWVQGFTIRATLPAFSSSDLASLRATSKRG
jgi:AraC-like DNA-binding protein